MSERRGKTYLALTGPRPGTTAIADWDALMARARAIADAGLDVFSLPFHRALPLLLGVEMATRTERDPRE
jgi:hypothetical protein